MTALFADLAGSTALQEALDVESTRSVMALYYERMSAVIEEHEGRLAKFIGDAIVAIFGAPAVREDDALRAVRAAAAMGTALDRLNEQLQHDWGVRLQMRTGVNTGELVLSHGSDPGSGSGREAGDGEEIVVGDVMNTAARLEQAAGAGEVLIGEETRRLVRHAVQLEPVAPLELKGKSEPVRAWRLVSVERPVEPDEMAGETPLVGRASELACLDAALGDAIEARGCRLVTVIGSPGVGKTRLAREFARAVDDRASVVEGRCEPSGEGITLLPIAEVLRGLAGIGEADPPEVVREKLGVLVSGEAERERLVEPLAGVLGIAAPASVQETFWALRRGLELLAARRPIVIVLDDLHWGQPMFMDLVEHLIEWVSDAPVLLLALARPELREVREALASRRRAYEVVELAPLDDGQSEALVNELLGGVQLPKALAQRIFDSSEGNPLFLGEMLRMLIDEGALQRDGDEWVAGAELASVQVPPTIHALLAARIERLDSGERSVVERAAVIGKEFYRGAVAELVAPPVRPRIDGHLEALRRKDMVEPDGTYWIDEPVYRFHHVLIRDAAYRSLLKEARAELHERFADWLQRKAGDLVGEHEEAIAFHLEQAHAYRRQLGPLDEHGRTLGGRAAQRLHSAGVRALEREDLAAAANLLERALDCDAGDDAGDDAGILWDLCEALLSAGDALRAAEFVERFAAQAGEDPGLSARACVLRAQLANLGAERTTTGERETADVSAEVKVAVVGAAAVSADAVEQAARTLAGLGDRPGEAKAWQVAAAAHARLGQVGAAEEALDRALAAARGADDRRRVTAVLTGAPRAALWGPSPVVRASGRCLDVVRILRMTPGNRHVEAIALRCQAVLEAMRGRFGAAREILGAGRATLEELGLTLELQESALHAGTVELLAGDTHGAVNYLREARACFESLGVASGAAQAAAMLAWALVEQGDADDEAIAQTRFAEGHGGEDLKTTITWCSARARALARQGQLEEAIELASRAVDLAQPTDALADKADASMALAQVLLAAGRKDEAARTAAGAGELYEAKGHTVGVERVARLIGDGEAFDLDGAPAGRREPRQELTDVDGVAPTRASRAELERRGESPASGLDPLGEQSPMSGGRTMERFWAAFLERAHARGYEDLAEMIAEDWALQDHRALGWEKARGREQAMTIMRSVFDASPGLLMEFDEVLACDERVIAARIAWRGRGVKASEFEVTVGCVLVVEDKQWKHADYYEPDDREAMLERYRQLGGSRGAMLGVRPPERYLADYVAGVAARDIDGLVAMHAEDCVLVDHRRLGWETVRGRHYTEAHLRSIFISPDFLLEVDRVLACDDRVIAVSMTVRGTTPEGGGDFEFPIGAVLVIEDGLLVSSDYYEHSEHAAILERYRELGGSNDASQTGVPETDVLTVRTPERILTEYVKRIDARDVGQPGGGALGVGRESLDGHSGLLGDRAPERFTVEFIRCHDARDLDGLMRLYAEDYVLTDHRGIGWEPVRDLVTVEKNWRSLFATSSVVRIDVDEVLACDERVIAVRFAWRGRGVKAGEFAYVVGVVSVVEDGRWASADFYEPDDRTAMLARYAELGGG